MRFQSFMLMGIFAMLTPDPWYVDSAIIIVAALVAGYLDEQAEKRGAQ